LWNCHALAAALSSLVSKAESEAALAAYEPAYRARLMELFRAKFGLATAREGDAELFAAALDALAAGGVDYTRFFRLLGSLGLESTAGEGALTELFSKDPAGWQAWSDRYRERLTSEGSDDVARRARMRRANPKFVLRNYLAQEVIEKAERGDYAALEQLHDVLRAPFDEHPHFERYAAPPEPSQKHIEVSCSS
jgi:uncharacterized protein YdiU (UPF0061 family)